MSRRTELRYGQAASLEVSLRDEAWVGSELDELDGQVEPLDVAQATVAALEQPLGFPPLAQAMVPGDEIAIALGADVRHADAVVRGVVAAIEQAGGERQSITVVAGSIDEAATLRGQLGDLLDDGVIIAGHTPADDQALCYLAAVDEAPLLICRELYEADLVIPVGCGRPAQSRDARGPFESIYPHYSDVATQRRYRQADALDSPMAASTRRQETDQAGWLLGAALVVQVVPAPGGGIARVIAGEPKSVDQAVAEACDNSWVQGVQMPARLVVATLSGDGRHQTWENLARALHAAGIAADPDHSAVAICTEIDTPPGETLGQLMALGGDIDRAASELYQSQAEDAAAAWEIYKALCRGPVYFMSGLEEEIVEELGMTPVGSPDELTRLMERSESCLVLNESQYAVPKITSTIDAT